MPRHISLLFPGQGSQSLDMLSTFSSSEINLISNAANNVLDIDIIDHIKNGPEEILNQTSITQPAILMTSYLYYRRFINDTGIVPDILAGHSLGEYTALLASESFDLLTAISLVHKRGKYMENAESGSMYAILNLDISNIKTICKEVEAITGQIVSAANINSNNQIVIAGNDNSTKIAADRCKEAGAKKCIQLKVSVASHCALMSEAANLLEQELQSILINKPKMTVLHNYDASHCKDSSDIKLKLKKQLFKPVQWVSIMNKIREYDGLVIECGPGKVLSGLAKTNGINNILSMTDLKFKDELKQLL